MTKVDYLLAAGAAKVPFDVIRAAYAELLVTDLEASRHFYVDLLGMVVAEESADAIYLRAWEERLHHSLVLRRAPAAGIGRISFRVQAEDELEPLRRTLEGLGATTRWVDGELSQMGRALRAWDPFGYPLEFFFEGLDTPSASDGDQGEFVRAELELLRAFRALPDSELQRQILRLVRSMGRVTTGNT